MKTKRIAGIVLVILGIVMLLASNHIKNEVAAGRLQIRDGQKKVDQVNSLFSARPETKFVGKQLTGSAQKKIDAGRGQVDYYTRVANYLQVGGIICIIAGGVVFVLGLRKKHEG